MNNKIIVSIVVIVILVVAGIMIFNKNDQDEEQAKFHENINSEEQKPNDTVKGNVLEGTLKTSNDPARGNLMLELLNSDQVIYLRTSRDFSSLIGKDVAVTIDGTMEKFSLIDIQLMSKDGSVKIN